MNLKFEDYIGASTGPRKMEYNWRDVALYALAIGAHAEDLPYYYERCDKGMKAIPSFAISCFWNAVNVSPKRPLPYPASMIVSDAMTKALGYPSTGLDWGHDFIMHRPIDPIKGSFVFEDVVTKIYDRGAEKGIIIESEMPVYDEAGNLVCSNIHRSMMFQGGGFGGEPLPKSTVVIPDREPDYVLNDHVGALQNALYRLTGDTNPLHIDPEFAKTYKFDRPIMQGFCSIGYACRMGIEAIIPGESERMTRLAVDLRGVCYPGTNIQFAGWKADGAVAFRLMDMDAGKPILDRCVFEYK
jgi:hypothetical protein